MWPDIEDDAFLAQRVLLPEKTNESSWILKSPISPLTAAALQMIICKRPAPPDDHLQEAGPFGSSFARGRPLILTTTKRAWKMLSCYLVTLSDSHCPDHCVRCFNHLCCIFKVAARWAVTAAHCFFRNGQQEIFEKDMTFVIGVHDRRVINNKLRWQKLTLIVNLEEGIFLRISRWLY